MKIISLSLLSILLTHCLSNHDNAIEGTYVRNAESEFSKAWDTITIKPYNESAGTYIIYWNKGFQRTREGKLLAKEFKKEELMGEWDSQKQQLSENKKGLLFSLSASGKELRLNNTTFQKLD